MLQVPFIRENKAIVIERLSKRNIDATTMIDAVIDLDEKRRSIQTELDNTLAESNSISKEIGGLFKSGKVSEANVLKAKTGELKEASKTLSEQLNDTAEKLKDLLFQIPNVPHQSVPNGNTDEDNEECSRQEKFLNCMKALCLTGN